MSVEGVARELDRVLGVLPHEGVSAALTGLTEARDRLRDAAAHSGRSEYATAVALLTSAVEACSQAAATLADAERNVREFRAYTAEPGSLSAPPVAHSSAQNRVTPPRGVAERAQPLEQVERLRSGLPPDVPARRPRGAPRPKTHGRWTDPSGQVHEEVSGLDDKARAATDWFESRPGGKVPMTVADVEIKLAVYMRQNAVKETVIAINNIPCEGPFGCDILVPEILPEGYTMTVHGTGGFRKVYHGMAK